MRDLARLKGKSIVQPSQDNRHDMVKKLENRGTMTCFKCHQEGHKSYKCPQPKKMVPDEKNKKSFTIKSSLIYNKPNRRNKSKSTFYVIKKKSKGKIVAKNVGKKDWSWNRSIWVPKEVITNMKGHQMVWVPRILDARRSASGHLEAWLTR
jgi:hypothetical protein